MKVQIFIRVFFENIRCSVGRAIIHDDDFPFAGIILRQQGMDAGGNIFLFITNRDKDRNPGKILGSRVPPGSQKNPKVAEDNQQN